MNKIIYDNALANSIEITSDTSYDTLGYHIVAELGQCNTELLTDLSFIQETMESAVVKAGATIINSHFHQFSPIGVSGVILLSESHASIHTWPDRGYASIDIYTCGDHVDPRIAANYIAESLESQQVYSKYIKRGIENNTGFSHQDIN